MIDSLDYVAGHPDVWRSAWVEQAIALRAVSEALITHRSVRDGLAVIVGQWDAVVVKLAGGLKAILDEHPSGKRMIYDSMRALRCTGKMPIRWRFECFMRAMRQIAEVAQRRRLSSDLWRTVILELPGSAVLVPYAVFSGTVIRMPEFMSEEDRRLWMDCEAHILHTLTYAPGAVEQISGLQDSIEKRFQRAQRKLQAQCSDRG